MTPNPPNINKLQIPGEAKIILNAFSKITFGEVTITTPENFIHYFTGNKSGPHVNLKIKNWDICREILKKSDIGLAETYLNGLWESDSVSDLIEFSILNEHALMSAFKGSWLKILYYRIIHNKRENTKEGSKKNIAAHYDLGNDFYQLWLDKTMSYSSAMFNGDYSKPHSKAQEDKYQSMLDLIKPASNDHILEIGCGWGGFLEYAGKKGYKVTGITISKAQYEFAIKRIEALGLSELITIKICDYRDIEATFPDKFDHAVSIEMIEAVGEKYWPSYFDTFKKCLKKNGRFAIQSIVMNDNNFDSYKKGTDFIQQYIFPGGLLLSPNTLKNLCAKNNYQFLEMKNFGIDYAYSLKLWREEFFNHLNEVKKLGFDERFIRLWSFYLSYCEGAFKAERIDVVQISASV